MSFFNTTVSGHDGITAEYHPERESAYGDGVIPATVFIELSGANGYLSLSIEDARTLAEALPGVVAEHEAAVSASVDKAA
ncbi:MULTISPECIES: hypothetical protein [Nocardia]|uniref:hypothetical protein n=1 Tax=Nocardia TaxID=1817 RepID=UPI00059352B6|nr:MULTISPECIES: hypothetical protein [Nocardia]MBF6468875.1 hypothetical protein [Nocardia beijingensis]